MRAALVSASLAACSMSHVEGDAGRPLEAGSDGGGWPDAHDASVAADALVRLDARDGGVMVPDAPTGHLGTFHDYCGRITRAICAGYDACCTRAGRRGGADACPTIIETCDLIRDGDPAFAALTDGSVRISASLAAYLAELEGALASCSAWPAGAFEDFAHGDVGIGGDCTPTNLVWPMEAYRCSPGLFCAVSGPASGGWSGVCAAPDGSGAHCFSNAACADGHYCRMLAAPETEACRGRCLPQVGSGASCDDDSQCVTGLCIGVCVARLPSDDWCEPLYGA